MKLRYLYFLAAFIAVACEADNENDPDPSVDLPMLKSITVNLSNNEGGFSPGSKTVYSYTASGELNTEEYFFYDVTEKEYVLSTTATFTYAGGNVSEIVRVGTTGHTVSTHYSYFQGKLSAISIDDGIDTDITISYDGDMIEATVREE